MRKFSHENFLLILFFVLGLLISGALSLAVSGTLQNTSSLQTAAVINIVSPFSYSFKIAGILNETGSITYSTSPYWWVNSGGEMILEDGAGMTMQGDVPASNQWHKAYASSNPTDTDGGLHPQNIFRLVTRSQWNNVSAQAQFYIKKDNFSSSPNQNASNGLLLMNRYVLGGQTLYYAGIRVDGTAVIKKKYHGTYYTMTQPKVFPGTYGTFNEDKNFIPHNEWIGLRANTFTNDDGSVTITLSMQREGQTTWVKIAEATDTGQYGGTPPITGPGYMGIRTDFMDVNFDSFRLENL